MGETSYLQTSFYGGEWSQTYQGRMDDPHYRTAMAVCLNAFPTETGAWTRRSGAQFLAFTRGGAPGRVVRFDISETNPYVLEFTDNFLRFYGFGANSVSLITTNDQQVVTGISTANPTVVTTTSAHGWATGNTVLFSGLGTTMKVLQNRQFLITVISPTTFSLQDALTGANVSGAAFGSFMGGTVARVLELQTNYYGTQWQQIISIQAEKQSVLVNGQAPQLLTLLSPPTLAANATFSLAAANFQDGPYLDPVKNSIVNYDAQTGVINLTFSFVLWSASTAYTTGDYVSDGGGQAWKSLQDNNFNNMPVAGAFWTAVNSLDFIGPNGFTAADIGRHIRLFSEPAPWSNGTTYAAGNVVSFPGGFGANTYWQSLVGSNVGVIPGTSVSNWALVTGANYAAWTWGKIISTSGTKLTLPAAIGNMTATSQAIDGTTKQTAANSASAVASVTTYPAWVDNTAYAISTNAYYNGFFYQTLAAFSVWGPPNSYSVGAIVEQMGNYYKCLVAQTPGPPPPPPPQTSPSNWLNLGVANPSNTNVWMAGAAAQSATIDVFVGAHLSLASEISQATVYPASDLQWGVMPPTLRFNLWGSNSSPGSAQSGTLLGSNTMVGPGPVTIQNTAAPSSSFAYVWVEVISTNSMLPLPDNGTHSYTATAYVAQIQLFAPNVAAGGCKIELLGDEDLYPAGTTIYTWQAGLYSNAAGWPTCGTYYEGRLWLAGATNNRIDASMSNNLLVFSPTGDDGTVADDNGISFTFNADGVNTIFWMQHMALGIVCGTDGGEWLVPNASPPLTPSNISASRVTKATCADIEAVPTEHTLCIVQRRERKVFEYFADVFSGKFTAPNIVDRARHLTTPFIQEIRYQNEITPTVWARCGDGSLIGCTYRRDTLMTSQGPTFYGWHRHKIDSLQVKSITVGPSQLGTLDSLVMTALDPSTNYYHVLLLADYFEEGSNFQNAFLLDDAVNPTSYTENDGVNITINGLWHLNGKTVQVFAAGLDCGMQDNIGTISDFTVSNGSVTVPFGDGIAAGSGAGLFTPAFVNQFPGTSMPLVVGLGMTSQGQLLRPVAPAEAGTRQGPGFGKKRRNHRFAVQVVQTNGLSIGTDFSKLQPVPFRPINGAVPVLLPNLFTGVFQDELRDDFTYDGQICWQISRPVPGLIAAIGGFIDTADI